MARFPFYWIDAFSDRPLAGNPCAVLLDADALDADVMQRIAREMKLSETAFVRRAERADFAARYFTPAREIPMAGHPTLATARALVDAGRVPLAEPETTLTLELPAARIPVTVACRDGAPGAFCMTQPAPRFGERPDPVAVAAAFGLGAEDLDAGAPQVVSTGTPQLMIPLRDARSLARVQPDPLAHRALAERHGFFSSHLFAWDPDHGSSQARHFAPQEPAFEDPFTGSATGAMAGWLWRHGRIPEPRLTAHQGAHLGRPGRADVAIDGPREAIAGVRVGGHTAVLVRGVLDV